MSELLNKAIAEITRLPNDIQDEVARVILAYVGSGSMVKLTPDEHAALQRSEAAADRGDFASDEDVRAVFDQYRQ